jgi:4-hydroxyphenylacetate 3-monooxygenase
VTFQLFAQSAPFAHLAAVYRNFDWDGPLDFVRRSAGLSGKVLKQKDSRTGDRAVNQWFGQVRDAAE